MPTQSASFQLCVAMRSSQVWMATPASTSSRSRMRMFLHMRGLSAPGSSAHGAAVLRLEPRGRPGSGLERAARQRREATLPEGAVVNARLALHPKLHRIGPEPIAAPVGRPGNVGADVVFGARAAGRGHAE